MRILAPLLSFWLVLSRCLAVAADEPSINFNRDVRPILSDKCFFCHGPDGSNRQADLRLDEREAAIGSGAIAPGKPHTSAMLARVLSQDDDQRMPPPASKLGSLTAQEIDILTRWIASGADYQPHWSFIPLESQKLPPEAQGQHPIDFWVRGRLAQRQVVPQPPADPATLIRRLSLDLTGLPPSPAEVNAFTQHPSPKAYEQLVDRLLSSPRYGERMAVDWLDVARYADSFGFQVDREREMWPWRDWVIRAFNENLPYDQFITWQVAGDLLPGATDDQILATAFNRLHQQESEGGSVEEEYRVEYVCDRVQTFATAFLGLTFECARCHNHKYDPVTQRDYYGLFAMFQNIDEAGLYSFFTQSPPTPTLWLADAATKQRLAELAEQVDKLEQQGSELVANRQAAYHAWTVKVQERGRQQLAELLNESLAKEQLGSFAFDELVEGQLANAVDKEKPAKLKGENKLVAGHRGSAIEFTGDDAVDLPFGNFSRHQPFSLALWLKTPDVKERAVVLHRSRAWTDAASRGYELLIEEGRLKWSLIHFWPGNALSIATKQQLPIQQWQHVAVSYDGSSRASGLRIFVNGQPAEVEIVKDHLTKEITGGGGDNIALGERFRDRGFRGGQIDDLRVFARQLSALEMLALCDSEQAVASLVDMLASDVANLQQPLFEFYLSVADEAWSDHLQQLAQARKSWMSAGDSVKEIMAMRELSQPKKAYILARGDYSQRGEEVSPAVPSWLAPLPDGAPLNRLGVAQWLTDPSHPLTARVTVNRVWQMLFGRGLVKTAEDFGSQGARPNYPEVLDWLAEQFIASGWDMKQLIKTIVTSQTYRQRSWAEAALLTDDPDNEWLARGARFRLPAEMIRDNALASAGLLAEKLGGPPVNPYEMAEAFKPTKVSDGEGAYRRSLYTNWRRTGPPPAMIAFDAPRRAVCTAKRERTDSPLQALILLNGDQYVEAARVLGETLHRQAAGDVRQMIHEGALRCLSRPVDAAELTILTQLYNEQLAHYAEHVEQAKLLLAVGKSPRDESIPLAQAAAATLLAQALLNHDLCVVRR